MLSPDAGLARALSLAAYPLIVFGCPALAWGLYRGTGDLALATGVGMMLAGVASIGLESVIPFREDWFATRDSHAKKNTRLNLLYVVTSALSQELVVKTALYAALVPLFAWLAGLVGGAGWWPHRWPIVAQVLLLLVASDFLQYWTHRIMHEWPRAWALHKVHHSLESLNWSAIGRMHPLEHFVASGGRLAPMLAAGVSPEVVLVYLTFLNCQGFAVHTNIRFDTRLLNRLLYTPDHHRFHHSRILAESNANYAGPLLLWDVVFGSLILPNTQGPEVLGLLDDDAMQIHQVQEPRTLRLLAQQLLSPFSVWAGRTQETGSSATPEGHAPTPGPKRRT